MRNNRTLQRPGPILVILIFFSLSAVLRVGSQGMAIAEEVAAKPEEVLMAPDPTPDVGSLLASIQERQEQLSRREEELAQRLQLLNSVEERVAQQMVVLQQAEQKLASTLAIADSATENDLARLTTVYEKMKPKNAAEIFQTMEMSFAAGFLSRMKPEAAAGIMSEMPANTAYSVSVVMAGRNANAPTE